MNWDICGLEQMPALTGMTGIALGILTGALPAVLCWRATAQEDLSEAFVEPTQVIEAPIAATKGS